MARIVVANPNTLIEQKVYFNFSSGQLTLQAVAANSVMTGAWININTAFDGVGAAVKFGTTAVPGMILNSGEINLAVVDKYGLPELVEFMQTDYLLLTVTAPGSTQGAGTLVYQYRS
jgi:hypothetical protein